MADQDIYPQGLQGIVLYEEVAPGEFKPRGYLRGKDGAVNVIQPIDVDGIHEKREELAGASGTFTPKTQDPIKAAYIQVFGGASTNRLFVAYGGILFNDETTADKRDILNPFGDERQRSFKRNRPGSIRWALQTPDANVMITIEVVT